MLFLFFLLLLLLSSPYINCDDLQEALVNRNNRAAGSFSPSPYAILHVGESDGTPLCNAIVEATDGQFNCVMGCRYDSDCTWRLGTQTSKIKPAVEVAAYVAQLETLSNLLANLGYDGSRLTNPTCDGFFLNECGNIHLPESAALLSEALNGVPMTNSLFQTAVNYPNLRCLSGRCVHFFDDFPGYGEEYCMPLNATITKLPGQCAIPGMNCQRSINTDNIRIPFSPVSSLYIDTGNFVPDLVMQTKLFPDIHLEYSSDPEDIIGVCSCASDIACGGGMKCLADSDETTFATVTNQGGQLSVSTTYSTNRCYCTASSQCKNNGGGSQHCITNSLVIGSHSETIGTCSCIVNTTDSCNSKGICVSLETAFPQSTFQTYYTVEQYALGAAKGPTKSGRCECFGKVQAGSTWVETVTGSACEDDAYIDLKCSGRGIPICTSGPGEQPVFSLNGAGLIGVICHVSNFTQRGELACQCAKGFYPDLIRNTELTTILPCSIPIACDTVLLSGAVAINGLCECTGDSFQVFSVQNMPSQAIVNNFGACVPDCSLIKSFGKGVCFFNPNFIAPQLQPNIGVSYTNDVQCLVPGWTTNYGITETGKSYFDICYACTSTPPPPNVLFPDNVLRLEGPDKAKFCNVPVNPYLNVINICGDPKGDDPTSTELTVGAWSVNQCICMPLQCKDAPPDFPKCLRLYTWQNGGVYDVAADNGNNPIIWYQPQSPIPYCARTCQYLTANMTDPSTPNAYNPVQPQLCGGPKRGACVSDGLGGTICRCLQGYKGIACQTRICPVANGKMCSGNGICDTYSKRCICSTGFVGLACEFKWSSCGNSQVVKSYPAPNYNLPDY